MGVGVMKNYIILLNNSKVLMVNKIKQSLYSKCQYILIPVDSYDIDAYIMIKPNAYFEKFTDAQISFKTAIMQETADNDSRPLIHIVTILDTVDKHITDLKDIVNYLHSLNRISYVNSMSNGNEYRTNVNYINLVEFNITLFEGKDIIYTKQIKYSSDNTFSIDIVLKEIKDLYNPIHKFDTKYLRINNDEWEFVKSLSYNSIYGITLPNTRSISFLTYDMIRAFSLCSSLFCGNIQYNSTDFNSLWSIDDLITDYSELLGDYVLAKECGFRTFDVWFYKQNEYIEYIIYLKCIYMITTIMTEYDAFGKLSGKVSTYSWIEIEPKNYMYDIIDIKFNNDNIVTLSGVIDQIINKWIYIDGR
jgi:hypothetical protein